ncbi:hypothetical protein KHM83_17175, partial [Fusibacter paucivorans]|nr:hypothetical protein [Fusibacter paucivorans]
MSTMVKVGMADLKVTEYPNALTTLGLGSCVGICLYEGLSGNRQPLKNFHKLQKGILLLYVESINRRLSYAKKEKRR